MNGGRFKSALFSALAAAGILLAFAAAAASGGPPFSGQTAAAGPVDRLADFLRYVSRGGFGFLAFVAGFSMNAIYRVNSVIEKFTGISVLRILGAVFSVFTAVLFETLKTVFGVLGI